MTDVVQRAHGGPAADGGARPPCGPRAGDDRIALMGLLMATHTQLTRVLGAELERACGIPLSWYDVLIQLALTPDGRLTMSRLAGEIMLTSGGVTRLVDRVAEAGYVERQHCPSDRRSVYVALTPAGREMLEVATDEHLRGLDRHLLGPLTREDRRSLEAALRKLVGDLPRCTGEA